jgi:hypothetical protein
MKEIKYNQTHFFLSYYGIDKSGAQITSGNMLIPFDSDDAIEVKKDIISFAEAKAIEYNKKVCRVNIIAFNAV